MITDSDIAGLLSEPKPTVPIQEVVPARPKRGHLETQLRIDGDAGSTFRLIARQSRFDAFDFSVILAYEMPDTSRLFRLRRHNGLSHEHLNKIEGDRFFDYHVHVATERYQLAAFDEDAFAVPTDAYVDLHGAIRHMLDEAGFAPRSQTEFDV